MPGLSGKLQSKYMRSTFMHDTVFYVSPSTIQRRVEKFRERFSDGRMRYGEMGMNQKL